MEARASACEPDQDRHRPVRLRPGLGEEPVGDLALHHHAPRARAPARRSASRRRAASRRCTAGSRRAFAAAGRARRASSGERVADTSVDVRRVRRARRESAARARGRSRRRGRARHGRRGTSSGRRGPGPTSSTTSSGSSAASRLDDAEHVRSTRKCWPNAFFGVTPAHGDEPERRGRRSSSMPCLELARRRSPAGLGERRERVDDVRRLVRPAADRLRREVRAVGLGEQAVRRDAAAAARERDCLRVRDVAGERDVVAALERSARAAPAPRSSGGSTVPGSARARARVVVGGAACGSRPAARARRRARAARRRAPLLVAAARSRGGGRGRSRRPRRHAGARAARASSSTRPASASPRWCGSMPSAAYDAVGSPPRSASARAARLDPRADRDDPRRPRPRARASSSSAGVVAGVEMRVGVGHAAVAGSSTRGKSGCAGSMPLGRARPAVRDLLPFERRPAARAPRGSLRRARKVGGERDRDRPEPVAQVVEHLVELGGARLVLRELPRRRRLDMPVQRPDDLPDPLERTCQVEGVESRRDVVTERLEDRGDVGVGRRSRLAARRPGSGRPSPSRARGDCRGRFRAPARSARGGCRSTPCRPDRTRRTARTRTGPASAP